MIVVYCSGAYSDNPTMRTLDAIRECDRLEKKFPGVIFLTPHAMFHWWDQVSSKPYGEWMRYCMAVLKRCDINHRMNLFASDGSDKEELESRLNGQPFTVTDEALEWELKRLGWRMAS